MLLIFVFWGAVLEKSACPTDTLRHLNLVSRVRLLPVPSLANEVVGIFHLFSPLANFARRGHISKNSNVDPILGRTNRIRSSATTPGSVKFRV